MRVLDLWVQVGRLDLESLEMRLFFSSVHRRRRPVLLLHLPVDLPPKSLEVHVITGLRLPDHGVQFAVDLDLLPVKFAFEVFGVYLAILILMNCLSQPLLLGRLEHPRLVGRRLAPREPVELLVVHVAQGVRMAP